MPSSATSRYLKEIEEIKIMDQLQQQQQQQQPPHTLHTLSHSSSSTSSTANNNNNSKHNQQQQMLSMQHQHPLLFQHQPQLIQFNQQNYSTLHHPPRPQNYHQQQQQQPLIHHNSINSGSSSQSSSNNSSSTTTTQTMPFLQHHFSQQNQYSLNDMLQQQQHHHHHTQPHHQHLHRSQININQAHQQQQQQQQQMMPNNNTTSDYSASSTYHVYDQILGEPICDDLLVIKQERAKQKLEQEQKLKVLLFTCSLIFLIGLLMFLCIQLFKISSNSTPSSSSTNNLQANSDNIYSNDQQQQLFINGQFRPAFAAPSMNGQSKFAGTTNSLQPANSDSFDASKFNMHATNSFDNNNNNNKLVIQKQLCSGHGTPINDNNNKLVCRCDAGYFGTQCQESISIVLGSNGQTTATKHQHCQMHGPQFCSPPNGHCDHQTGLCKCQLGYTGYQCELKQSSINHHQMISSTATSLGAQSTTASTQQLLQPAVIEQICQEYLHNCNNNGLCLAHLQQCKCRPGFAGQYCQIKLTSSSSVATSTNAINSANNQANNQDLCLGNTCSNGRGQCQPETGLCQCKFGFYGNQCELDYNSPTQNIQDFYNSNNCTGNGRYIFAERKCICDFGFMGLDCSEKISSSKSTASAETTTIQPLPDAASTDDCPNSNTTVSLDCGPHGAYSCQEQRCICQDGFEGELCRDARCPARCLRNGGQCLPDGQCSCPVGRYGRHCSFDGCPNECGATIGRGQCQQQQLQVTSSEQQQQQQQPEWRCQCQAGFTGDDCSQLSERQCDDGLDNDGDGLFDCADSECCSDKVCQNSLFCMKSPNPLDILNRKQPTPPTASFFQRMQFLIEKSSSQIHTNSKEFNDSLSANLKNFDRASVIRGRVTYMNQGLTGVRVSVVGQVNLGITPTRDNGLFDLLVNGGNSIVLEFRRAPFLTVQKTVRVPWNEIVLMDPVEMQLEQQQQQQTQTNSTTTATQEPPICFAHNYRFMKPQIIATGSSSSNSNKLHSKFTKPSKHQQVSSTTSNRPIKAVILRDSQLVQQTIDLIPAAMTTSQEQQQPVSLVYSSSKANEFMSTIQVQLTPVASSAPLSRLLDELKLIHLRIAIEGNLFEQTFEVQSNLSFTYAWNRRNVYKQKSFGLSNAQVMIGYEYFDCKQIIWHTKQIQLAGYDLSISDIGSSSNQLWNLNVHYRFNYRDSILQRGDGQNFNLRQVRPLVAQVQLGDGNKRALMCPYCDGQVAQAQEHRLFRPQSVVVGPDNSIYVADYNLIRRIETAPVALASINGGGSGGSSSSSVVGIAAAAAASAASQSSERLVKTLLELPLPANKQLKYSLALSPNSGSSEPRLYIVDQLKMQVFLVREATASNGEATQQTSGSTNESNYASLTATSTSNSNNADGNLSSSSSSKPIQLVPVVGTGARCIRGDPAGDNCGDFGLARDARLMEPKSVAFDLMGRMYIADGSNIRMVDHDSGKIYTLLGDYYEHSAPATPSEGPLRIACESGASIPMHKFRPKWPQMLAVSPIDDSLHFLDDNVVYRITQDKRVQAVAGKMAHCHADAGSSSKYRASEFSFKAANSLAFLPTGNLLVADNELDDQQQHQIDQSISSNDDQEPQQHRTTQASGLARVYLIDSDEDSIKIYAGSIQQNTNESEAALSSNANTNDWDQLQVAAGGVAIDETGSNQLHRKQSRPTIWAHKFRLNFIGSIAVDQRGNLLVADQLRPRLVSFEPDLPQMNPQTGEYELQAPDNSNELLVFNRFGHHLATRELPAKASTSTNARGKAQNKYTFTYNVNTSFGQLASILFAMDGNKLSIYRDGPQHSVRMLETTGSNTGAGVSQWKLDVSRNGQLQSITAISKSSNNGGASGSQSAISKIEFNYQSATLPSDSGSVGGTSSSGSAGGLLKRSRELSGANPETYDFAYDEFGRAQSISLSSARFVAPLECRRLAAGRWSANPMGCSSLILAE